MPLKQNKPNQSESQVTNSEFEAEFLFKYKNINNCFYDKS